MTKISVLITGSQEDGPTFTLTVDSLKFEDSGPGGFASVLRQIAEGVENGANLSIPGVDLHHTSQETAS
jgi:hypothetical protein